MHKTSLPTTAVLIVDSDTNWWDKNTPPMFAEIRAVRVEDIDAAMEQLARRPIDVVVMELLVDDSEVYGPVLDAIQHVRRVWRKPVVLFTGAWQVGDTFDRAKLTTDLDVSAIVLKRPRGPEDDLSACIRGLLPSRGPDKSVAA